MGGGGIGGNSAGVQWFSDFALVRVQVGLEGQDLLVGAAGAAVEVQAREDLHVAHTGRVGLHQLLHPLGLLVCTLRGRKSGKEEGGRVNLLRFTSRVAYHRDMLTTG